MKHQLTWDKVLLEKFIEIGLLNSVDSEIMCLRVKEKLTPLQTSLKMTNNGYPVSESFVNKRIQYLKKHYDEIQKRYPEIFPIRVKNGKDKI